MKNNIYTAIPDWFNKVQSQSTDNTSTTTTQTTIIGGGGSISMSVHNLFIKSDTTITIDDFTISDLFVTDQITDTENWLTTPLLHTLPNTEVSVTTAAQLLYIGAYDKNNNQIKLYQFSEAISTVVIPENCYYLRASSNKTNTDLTIKYVGLNNFDETQLNKLESSSFQNFLTLVEGDEKGVITNSVLNLSLVFQNPLYYTLDKAGNVLISIDRDALFSQSENPTDDRYVTTVANSVQDILSSKNFKEGLSINGIEIVERNGFLYIKGNLATTGGITAYTDDPDDPGGSGGLPGGGAIGDIVITGSGNALVDASLSKDHSVITFTKGWLVDAESDQSITGIKDFINGLKLSGQLIKIVDGVLWLDCSIATTGGITAYATMPGEGSSSIMDQLVVDTEYFIITEEGVLTIVPGSVGGISNIYVTGDGNALTTVTLSEDGKTISFTKDKNFADQAEMSAYKAEVNQTIAEFKNEVNEQLKHFVTLDTEQEITAIKHFIEGVTIGSNKHKFYEKNGVLWLEGDIAITGGITTYATENVDVSTIMDGVAVDEITITKGDDNVLRVKDAGAGSSFDENAMWSALASSSDKLINKSHLTTALTGYATETWVSQNYATSSALESVSTKLNNFLEGSDTDNIINKWKELEAFLSGMAETDNLAEILETKADKSYVDSTFVTIATKQTITGEKTFSATLNTAAIKASGNITAPSLEASDYVTIAGIKFRKLENGAILVEGNLAATGGITGYAIDPVDVTTIMSGVVADETTITNDKGVLKIKNAGSGSGFDKSAMWTALAGSTTEQINKSHLTTALTGYATESWVSEKNYAVKATTLAGYGITDAYTKTDSDSRYINASGDTMTGDLYFNNSDYPFFNKSNSYAFYNISVNLESWSNNYFYPVRVTSINTVFPLCTVSISSTSGSASLPLNNNSIRFMVRTGGWSDIGKRLIVLDHFAYSSSEITIYAIYLGEEGGDCVVYLRGGVNYTISISGRDRVSSSDSMLTNGNEKYPKIDLSGNPTDGRSFAKCYRAWTHADGYGVGLNAEYADNSRSTEIVNIASETGSLTGTALPSNVGLQVFSYYYSGNGPTTFGNFLRIRGNGGGCGELFLGWLYDNNTNYIWYKSKRDVGSWGDWRQVAFTDMNVASATKLQNARTFWRQSFNGTANVSGDMYDVGWINGGLSVYYGNDLVGLRWRGVHDVEFGGNTGYAHVTYHFRPCYSSNGPTQTSILIENASASNSPTFTMIHAFWATGVGYHRYALGVGREAPANGYAGGVYANTVLTNDWFRSEGNTGWYSQTYGGGWYMTDSTWIRAYNNKSIAGYNIQGSGKVSANNGMYVYGMYGSSWGSGDGAYGVAVPYNENQTTLLLAYNGTNNNTTGSDRYFSIEVLNRDDRNVRMLVQGQHLIDLLPSKVTIFKDLLVEGGGTFYSSDIRYKSIIQQIKLSLSDIAKAPSFVYHWNKKGMKCDRLNLGGSAQYTQSILPWAVENNDGFLSMDYATVAYTFSVHTARHLMNYETKTDKEIRKLKNRIKYLEKQLKSLHYEEANIVDD